MDRGRGANCGLAGAGIADQALDNAALKDPRSPALELRNRIAELAAKKRRFGYRRIQVLLRREGWSVKHKRTYRLYREQGLMVRKRKRTRIGLAERLVRAAAQAPT